MHVPTHQQRGRRATARDGANMHIDAGYMARGQLPSLGTAKQTQRSLVVSPHVVSRDEAINQITARAARVDGPITALGVNECPC